MNGIPFATAEAAKSVSKALGVAVVNAYDSLFTGISFDYSKNICPYSAIFLLLDNMLKEDCFHTIQVPDLNFQTCE